MIIAFGHRSRVGKDTASQMLVNHLRQQLPSLRVNKTAFADQLKIVAHHLYGWAGIQNKTFYDNNPDERLKRNEILGMTPRDLWVEVGMKIRSINPDTWVNTTLEQLKKSDIIIISDLRFQNEASIIKQMRPNSKLVRIFRPEAPLYDSPADNALEGQDVWTHHINNVGDLTQFHDMIIRFGNSIIPEIVAST